MSDTSQRVSIMERAVNDPPPLTFPFKDSGRSFICWAISSLLLIFAALSSNLECK